jgi:hypothetical protein
MLIKMHGTKRMKYINYDKDRLYESSVRLFRLRAHLHAEVNAESQNISLTSD